MLWRATLGQGYSGFVIAEGRAYTQMQTAAGQFVVCLDLETGEEIWRTRYAWPRELDNSWAGPYATPTYDGGKIFFAGSGGVVGSMDAKDGRVLWTLDTKERFDGRGTGFGYAATPLVEGGRVFLPVGGENASVVALDARDGSVLWAVGSDPASYVPCYPVTVEGRRQIVSVLEQAIVARDPASGNELWRYPLAAEYNPRAAWPLFEPPYLFVAFALREGAVVLRPGYREGAAFVEPVWSDPVLSNDVSSSVAVEGFVYGFDIHDAQSDHRGGTKGEFKCVELSTGRERWSTGAVGNASVLTDGKHLLLLEEDGSLVLAEATPEEYRELARASVFEGVTTWGTPAIHGDRILVRAQEQAACLAPGSTDPDLRDGRGRGGPRIPLVDAWTARFQDRSFWAPSGRDLSLWFALSVTVVLGVPLLLAAPLGGRIGQALFFALSPIIGVLGLPVLTELAGRLVLTWPAALFAAFLLTYMTGLRAARRRTRRDGRIARAAILGFVAVCAVYFLACQRLFLLAGWGFLIGFVPALPLFHLLSRRLLSATTPTRTVPTGLLTFAVYFWSSALVFAWKTGSLW